MSLPTPYYSSARRWSGLIQVLCALLFLMGIVRCIVSLTRIVIRYQLDHAGSSFDTIHAVDQAIFFIGGLQSFLFFATGLVVVGWIFKSHRNLAALQADEVRFSPWSAAALWLVPCVNYLMAFPILLEIWEGSDPAQLPSQRAPEKPASRRLIIAWFSTVILMVLANMIAMWFRPASGHNLDFTAFTKTPFWLLTVPPLFAARAALFGMLVRRITHNQDERRR